MRIGFDAKRAFNNGTGLGNYSRSVIRSLTTFYPGHEYFLFTPAVKPAFEQFIPASPNVHLITPETFLGKTFSSAWRSFSITDLVKQFQLDVFHGLSNELPSGIEKIKTKGLVTIHDLIFLRYPAYYNNIDRYIYTKKFRHACERADLVLATSEQTKQDLIHFFNTEEHKIKVTYQGCDERFGAVATVTQQLEIRTKYALPEKYILCVGTIEQRKDQLTVLKAFHQLNDGQVKLFFVGRPTDYMQQLQSYISTHGLSDQVMFLNDVSQEDLPVIYRLASLFIYASEFEGFGIPVLEALQSHVPVIAAQASSLPEVGGEAALYFKPGDAGELLAQVRVLLYNQAVRQQLAEKATEQVKQFDAQLLAEQLVMYYGA